LIIEVHQRPEEAVSDGAQSLKPERFAELVRQIRLIAPAVGRTVAPVKELPVKEAKPVPANGMAQ
jgi:3-deoxy-7-phosphoheptulonate synthase